MIDLGISKIALIGAVALVVIGPDKLPGVARTLGALLGKAQRYVADVKAEVNRSMDLEELKKMRDSVQNAAQDVQSSIQGQADDFEKSWSEMTDGLAQAESEYDSQSAMQSLGSPAYKTPKKNWRTKQAAVPRWYKVRSGVRTSAQSGAARVARYRPRPSSSH
ncbi:MAG: Sec-independent protein translocase subunit TatB [Hydrogenophaga sp.]|jgi:sec-independent protein translocase protein TatB|nr:Sec-independent protein translocase subunit TatB [Hydrogenophaga sp.]